MADLLFKNIKKIYDGKVTAVTDFNLSISDKEFIVLVGPSGCGKSTVLRMIAGLEDITDGELFIDDLRVNDTPPKHRDIAMVFQNYALYPHMSVYQNLAFGLKLRNFKKTEIDERVREAADILGLAEYLERKPKALSGGQRQRVAVGRAIVRHPKVFLFDEPLSNLDAKMRLQMRSELCQLHQRIQATMVYVTHDQVEAMTMGSRIVVMSMGEIQQVDEPMKIYNHPANEFVASFIGSPPMNLFRGTVENGSVQFKGHKVPLTKELEAKVKQQNLKGVTIGIRPQDLRLAKETDPVIIASSVDLIETLGAEAFIHGKVEDTGFVAIVDPMVKMGIGDSFKLTVPGEKISLFNPETTMAI